MGAEYKDLIEPVFFWSWVLFMLCCIAAFAYYSGGKP